MKHPAHVAFVYTHAESDGGANHLQQVFLELVLHRLALLGWHARMVTSRLDPFQEQVAGHVLRVLAGETIDDSGVTGMAMDIVQDICQLLSLLVSFYHLQVYVGTVKRTYETFPVQPQLSDDILSGQFVRRGRKSHYWHMGKHVSQFSQPCIFLAEIMPPLTDAMGLVYGKQTDGNAFEQIVHFRKSHLWGKVEQLQFPSHATATCQDVLFPIVPAIERGSGNAVCLQGVHLVVHQADKGRDDDGRAFHGQGWQLIAYTLAASRWH